jgi:hypothetical protein
VEASTTRGTTALVYCLINTCVAAYIQVHPTGRTVTRDVASSPQDGLRAHYHLTKVDCRESTKFFLPLNGLSSKNQGEAKVVPIDRYRFRVWPLILLKFKGPSSFKLQKNPFFKWLKPKHVAYPYYWGACCKY